MRINNMEITTCLKRLAPNLADPDKITRLNQEMRSNVLQERHEVSEQGGESPSFMTSYST